MTVEQLLEYLRAAAPDADVVMYTAGGELPVRVRSMRYGQSVVLEVVDADA